MFTRPSFFALMVAPSARSNMSRTISSTERSACPSSRSLMNQAFSANRQASRKSGLPYLSQIFFTPRRFSSETGCPPEELQVMVTITKGTSSPRSVRSFSSLPRSISPLKGATTSGFSPSGVSRSMVSAPLCSMFARVVSKWALLGTIIPTPAWARADHDFHEQTLAGPTLVGGQDIGHAGDALHDLSEAEVAGRAGIGLVAAHHPPAHCSELIAPVPESVSRSMSTFCEGMRKRL